MALGGTFRNPKRLKDLRGRQDIERSRATEIDQQRQLQTCKVSRAKAVFPQEKQEKRPVMEKASVNFLENREKKHLRMIVIAAGVFSYHTSIAPVSKNFWHTTPSRPPSNWRGGNSGRYRGDSRGARKDSLAKKNRRG